VAADRVRDEAERLVAAALAAVSSATRGLGGPGTTSGDARGAGQRGTFATGSSECCVCPVCRAIAAMRDPGSDLAERLAAGVGDLASGVTAILRTLSSRGARPQAAEEEPAASEGDEFWEDLRRRATDAAKAYTRPGTERSTVDDPWRAATREPASDVDVEEPTPVPETLVPRPTVAKKTAKKAAAPKAVAKKTVKKAVAKKAVTKVDPSEGAA